MCLSNSGNASAGSTRLWGERSMTARPRPSSFTNRGIRPTGHTAVLVSSSPRQRDGSAWGPQRTRAPRLSPCSGRLPGLDPAFWLQHSLPSPLPALSFLKQMFYFQPLLKLQPQMPLDSAETFRCFPVSSEWNSNFLAGHPRPCFI